MSVLSGIRVLDLTRLLPGAFCTMLLADLGADVIKVEEPGSGDYMRLSAPQFEAINRNKRSIVLDLKSDRGKEILLRLVDTADVLVEGNRPGVMKRLGIGWDVLHARRPRLVVCSITGYGQTGPFASRAGHDLNYMAVAGALGLNGERNGPPVPLSVQVADIGGGGLQPAVEILAALVAVGRGEEGRWIDVSMTDGAMRFLTLVFATRAAGDSVARGDDRLTGRFPCYRVYECADGRYYSVAALEPKFWKTLCDALERPDLVDSQFSEAAHRTLEEIFRARSRDEWSAKLDGLDVCCEPVLDVDEVASHPQVKARNLFGSSGRPPELGEHTEDILRELGL
ncbi:MAG TPA: CaiB/BaiF CoA-transferase family protein [Candidatus Dormibacteraeota bacterium]|nr:CaiB/BaiF CoA-transferase family protein [Candidatus Dormibacteraeota bacterium]